MNPIRGRWYDGKTSEARPVTIHADGKSVRVIGEGIDFTQPLADVRPSSRVANTRRQLYFPDGSQCETEENDAVDLMFADVRRERAGSFIHKLESRTSYALIAAVATVLLLWGAITYGIPALAKHIAFELPESVERALGRDTLAALDQLVLEPTHLDAKRVAELNALFAEMTRAIPQAREYRLELRSSARLGANALALPSGIIVVTDGLVNLAKNDTEITAVLAHEIGHLRQRHSLRMVLHGSAATLLVIAVTGDVGSALSLGAAFPAMLLQSSYSRDFEREADDFAFEYLRGRGLPTAAIGDILQRLETQSGRGSDGTSYLSTHPTTQDRAARAAK